MSDLLCSVVVPTFNRADFLARSVGSVLAQDCIPKDSIEVLVIDDASKDDTQAVVDRLKSSDTGQQVVYRRVKHLGRPGLVRNVGLEVARGEFIAYCDSDDYWLPHHLATALQYFKRRPEIGMVSNYWARGQFTLLEDGEIETKLIPHKAPWWLVNTNCRVHRRECLEAVGFFSEEPWGEDKDFFERIEAAFDTLHTGIVTNINGYIKGGNNISYEFDEGVRARFQ